MSRRMRDTTEWNWSRSWFNDTVCREGRFGAISRRRIGFSGRNNWGSIIQYSNGSRNRIVWNVMRDSTEWNWSRSWFNSSRRRIGNFPILLLLIARANGLNDTPSVIPSRNISYSSSTNRQIFLLYSQCHWTSFYFSSIRSCPSFF